MTIQIDGLLQCSKYSLPPNSLHYCGPEKQRDLRGYIDEGVADPGLFEILSKFDTLYKYLVLIASSNAIPDPFDRRVVEAYWLGNNLLKNVGLLSYVDHLSDTLGLKWMMSASEVNALLEHSASGVPHHNFHVFNVHLRTGHVEIAHTLETMDQCRISWGRVVMGSGNVQTIHGNSEVYYGIKSRPLLYKKGRLILGAPVVKIAKSLTVKPKPGDLVSLHWGYVCEVINESKRKQLAYFTHRALANANTAHIL